MSEEGLTREEILSLDPVVQEAIAMVGLSYEEQKVLKESIKQKKLDNKVYCKYCKWYDFPLHGDYRSNCIYPDNKNIQKIIDNWNSTYIHFMASGEKPSIINQSNDCIWYIELVNADKSITITYST